MSEQNAAPPEGATATPATEPVGDPTAETPPIGATTPDDVQRLIDEAATKASREANREAQNLRKRLKDFEAAEAARKEAEMSELERANARATALETAAAEAEAKAARATFEREVVAAAAKHNLADPADAIALLAGASSELLDGDGVEEAVKQIAESKPYLLKQTAVTGTSGNATSPGRQGLAPRESDQDRLHRITHGGVGKDGPVKFGGFTNPYTGEPVSHEAIINRAL